MRRSRFLPLTVRGVFMFALSIAILTLGILRTDMAGLFWGACFLLILLYAVTGNAFTRALASRGKNKPGFLEAHLPASVLSPGDEAEAHVALSIPRALVPGFSVVFSLPLSWHERRIDTVRAVLSPGANSRTIRFRAEKRGSYAADTALIEVRDILGFTHGAVSLPLEESVRVFPRILRESPAPASAEEGGDSVRFSAHRLRSEELLEVRKYFPGDDIRKLNWKVFAHLNELFLRIGEETPPPESRFLYILDAARNPRVPPKTSADYLDGLVEACASAMSLSLSQGVDILFIHSNSGKCRSFSQESREDLMAVLADVWWSEPEWVPELPPRARMHAVVFSSPGSPALDGILAEIKNRGWRASLFQRDIPLLDERREKRALRDFFFVPQRSP